MPVRPAHDISIPNTLESSEQRRMRGLSHQLLAFLRSGALRARLRFGSGGLLLRSCFPGRRGPLPGGLLFWLCPFFLAARFLPGSGLLFRFVLLRRFLGPSL